MQSLSLKRILTLLTVAFLAVIAGRFLYLNVPHYFVFTEASYTSYYWPRHNWVITHVVFGMTALILGSLQFFPAIRKKYVQTHRAIGRTYLVCIPISATAATYLVFTSKVNFVYAAGLFALAVVWVTTSAMAYMSIRRQMISTHREWMVRSYVVTFAFVTFRLFDDLLARIGVGPEDLRLALLSWSCWSVPLFITEVILQLKKLMRVSSSTPKPKTNIPARQLQEV